MTPEEFKDVCSALGLSPIQIVSPDEVDGDEVPLEAENGDGDTIHCHKSPSTQEWVLTFDISGVTLHTTEFKRSDVEVDAGDLIVDGVSGSGYDMGGFSEATIQFNQTQTRLTEQLR